MNSKKKMPTWLKSRKYLLVSIILDSLLLLSLYPFEYIENLFTFKTIFSLIIIYFIWLISNYIIGKYSDNKDYFSIIDFKKSLKIFIEIPILLIINITSQKIIFNINDLDFIGLDKKFVFSIICILIFREIITLIFVYFNLRLRQKKSPIYFIGSVKTFEIFKKNLINNEKNYNFNFISLNKLNNYKLSNLRKIIIEDKNIFKDENFLLFFNNNNLEKIKIYSLFEWFEIYFNRYPSDFFYLE